MCYIGLYFVFCKFQMSSGPHGPIFECQVMAFLFLFVGIHHPPHFDFGKSKKKKKKKLQVLENANSM